MPDSSGSTQAHVVLRLSVPAAGDLRTIASDVAARAVEYAGRGTADAEAVAAAIEGLIGRVAAPGADAHIEFVFRTVEKELLVEARSAGRASELRYPLPA